ncbi:Abi family protein [Krasilnikoviella flava]|uniref:Abortive infection bacteriophage resistance protein n=1 Tax=Krasilnikoviella flava TaxID=526729 RepID=A0A1T5JK59_9MICO|nr:Abi family protein [Krasilnikoviella flava]SKC51799.1 Abortive infection bacteriophage resistance protein [Krasilnikoviella flava]
MVTYSKPYRSFDEQARLLLERGIEADMATCLWAVERIGYYRLSGYWYPYRIIDDDASESSGHAVRRSEVRAGTTLDQVLRLYDFDRRLKLLLMDALERVEVAVRVELAYVLGKHSAYAYREAAHLDGRFTRPKPSRPDEPSGHARWLAKYEEHLGRSSEDFVKHFQDKYDGDIPIWVAVEVLDFGSMSILFHGARRADRDTVAARLGLLDAEGRGDGRILGNWLQSLNIARNTCAHHARLWNRNFVEQISTKRLGHIDRLRYLAKFDARSLGRVYPILAVTSHLMRAIDPTSTWNRRLREHLDTFPADDVVTLGDLGAPIAWTTLLS